MVLTSREQTRLSPREVVERPGATDAPVLVLTAIALAIATGAAHLVGTAAGPVGALVVAGVAGGAIGYVTRSSASLAWLGSAGWVAASLGGTALVLQLGHVERGDFVVALAAVVGGTVISLTVWGRHLRRLDPELDASGLWQGARRMFTAPTTGLAPAFLGGGMALPLVGAYGPNIRDTDAVWMTAAMQHVRDNGIGLLQQTHDAYMMHLTLGPLIGLGGHRAAVLFTIATMVGFVALTAYLAYRVVGSGSAALVASAVVLAMPGVVHQVDYYPMYAVAYTLGYGSGWLIHRAMSGHDRSTLLAVLGGIGLVLTYESHSAFMVFVLVPSLILILHPWRTARKPYLISMAALAVASLPRLWLNFSIGGYEGFRTAYNNTWFIQQGYLREINENMFGQNVDTSPLVYAENLRYLVEGAVGGLGMVLLLAIPVALAARHATNRARVFVATVATVFITALVVAGPGVYARYLSPLAAGLAIIVAAGVARLFREVGTPRTLGAILAVVLVIAAAGEVISQVENKSRLHRAEATNSYAQVGELVDDGRYVLGARSAQLTRADGNMRTLSPRTMSEEDFITYASWPDDESVVELVERLDVGWIFVRRQVRYEVEYHNSWLQPNYGLDVRHPLAVADSDAFCLVAEVQGHRLYRYGDCRPGDEGAAGDLGSEDPRLNPFREAMGLRPVLDPVGDDAAG